MGNRINIAGLDDTSYTGFNSPMNVVITSDVKPPEKKQRKSASLLKKEALEKEAVLTKAFATNYGLSKLAQALSEPVKRYMDMVPIGRQLLVTDQKAQGELAYFDLDIEQFPAVVVANKGSTHLMIFEAERVYVDAFQIAATPKIPFAEIRWRKYNVVQRVKERLKQGLGIREDLLVLRAFDAVYNVMNQEVVEANPYVTPQSFASAFEQIESWNLIGWGVVMNPHAVADIRQWVNANVDEVARIEIRQTGYLSNLWGANFFITKLVPVVNISGTNYSYIYVTAPPRFTGYMPFWADSEIYASNNMDDLQVGFVGWEMLGLAVWNPRSVVRIKFTV